MLVADNAGPPRAAAFDQEEANMTGMRAEDNAASIVGAYEAFSRGDIQSALAVFAPDIIWHVPGRGPLSRDYRGHTEVLEFFGQFMRLSDGTFKIRIDEVFAKDDRVVILCTETAQRGDRNWSSPQVHVWTVKDGRAIAFTEYEGDQQGEDEFWSMRV
jgi:ketosteroid isomerase-like protein